MQNLKIEAKKLVESNTLGFEIALICGCRVTGTEEEALKMSLEMNSKMGLKRRKPRRRFEKICRGGGRVLCGLDSSRLVY